jgi:4-diphosphocytidyl-2-C-methyl-D-erythritol kinase
MNSPTAIYHSPAKLNLFLHITGRRDDGYHELQTIFQLVQLHDTLEFTLPHSAPNGLLSLHCADPLVPLDNNLILQAAQLLQQTPAGAGKSISIKLTKQIPMGAGLGGGSSNAATTLLALNKLWNLDLSMDELARIGLKLGADVPLFINGRSAWGTGVGEVLEPLELPQRYYLILWPGIAVSTAEIFSQENLTRDSSAIKIADFLAGRGRNDCEQVVRSLYPVVDEALNWLDQYSKASLTGTGSCVFASFETLEEANAVLASLPKHYEGFVASGINKLTSTPQV